MTRSVRSDGKAGYLPGFFLTFFLAACGQADEPPTDGGRPARLTVPGTLEDGTIEEASGIAHSRRAPDLLWLHEDSGAKARLYAVDQQGQSRGKIKLDDADNRDWEDLAAYSNNGEPYLLVADIGDNEAKRKSVSLYLFREPDLAKDVIVEVDAESRIKFRYPEGPRDAEAVAIDVDNNRVLVLTKRDLPPRLYALALDSASDDGVDATLLGTVTTLPAPSRRDVEFAPQTKDWHWQPTAMDIADDGSAIAILTYRAVYYYAREGTEDWLDTLQKPPLAFPLQNFQNAEAIAFSPNGRTLFVTIEQKHAPLVRIDLLGAPES